MAEEGSRKGVEMEKIRLIFLVIGSFFFGTGMIWAGLLSLKNNESLAGFLYIIAAAVMIVMCILVYIHGKNSRRK